MAGKPKIIDAEFVSVDADRPWSPQRRGWASIAIEWFHVAAWASFAYQNRDEPALSAMAVVMAWVTPYILRWFSLLHAPLRARDYELPSRPATIWSRWRKG